MNVKGINGFKLKILMIVAIIMAFVGLSEAFSQATSVYRIQSLFLYNFTKHVKWENTEGATFTIGIYGNPNAFSEIKSNLESKSVWGNKINVIQIESPADVNKCHIAYMPKSNKKKIGGTKPSGIVLSNIADRLELLYPGKHKLDVEESMDFYAIKLELTL